MTSASVREPPQSIEAELAVLGAICWRVDAIDEALEILGEGDFYRAAHRLMFAAMVQMHEKRQEIDLVLLCDILKAAGKLGEVGGPGYVAKIVDTSSTSANIVHYAKIVREKAQLRRLIEISHEAIQAAHAQDSPARDIIQSADRAILGLTTEKDTGTTVPISDAVVEAMDHYGELAQSGKAIVGLPSGLPDLDALTGGFSPGNLVYIIGATSMGKTALALQIADYITSQVGENRKVLYISLEMSRIELVARLLGRYGGFDTQGLSRPLWVQSNMDVITTAAGKIFGNGLFIDDASSISLTTIRSKARKIKSLHGLDAIVVDYIQLMEPPPGTQNREQEVARISRGLKLMAKEFGMPVLVLSQIRRLNTRPDKRPLMSDMRESGAQEQDADQVISVYREDLESDEMEIHLQKHRNGPIGKIHVRFRAQTQEIECIARERDDIHNPPDWNDPAEYRE